MVTLKSLEIFYWAAQLSSFSRAAEKLNTTQPSVSQHIAALETELGHQLISRTTKPVSLTPDGHAAFQHAELILRQINRLEREFNVPSRARRTIRLSVSETIVQKWLNRFLEASHQAFPNVDFDISVDITAAMMKSLSDGEIDLAFMLGPAMIEAAVAASPKWSNIMATDQMAAIGLAMFLPAMSGAEPCTGSNMEGPERSGQMLAEAAKPNPPWIAAPRSVSMSPKRFEATITSRSCGAMTILAAIASMCIWLTVTSG